MITTGDIAVGAAASLIPPGACALSMIAQATPGGEAMGPVLSGIAQFGSVALVGALLTWEMVYRGPRREAEVSATHKAHQAEIAETHAAHRAAITTLTTLFLDKLDSHSQRHEAALDRNTHAMNQQTAVLRAEKHVA